MVGIEAVPGILEGMESGLSLRKACAALGVSPSQFIKWVEADSALQKQYARARAMMMDVHAEQLEEIGEAAANAESAVTVAGLRLQSENRKWLLSKLAPRKYGEKVEATIQGPDGQPVQIEQIRRVVIDPAKVPHPNEVNGRA